MVLSRVEMVALAGGGAAVVLSVWGYKYNKNRSQVSEVDSLIAKSRDQRERGNVLSAAATMHRAQYVTQSHVLAHETADLYEQAGEFAKAKHFWRITAKQSEGLRRAVALDRLAGLAATPSEAVDCYASALSSLAHPDDLKACLDGTATADQVAAMTPIAFELAKLLHNLAAVMPDRADAERILATGHAVCDLLSPNESHDCHAKLAKLGRSLLQNQDGG